MKGNKVKKQEVQKNNNGLGFTARTLAQLSLPHSDPKTAYYSRTSGITKLVVKGDAEIGVPYGVMPRLILTWLCTQAVVTQSPIISLAPSQAQFLNGLGLANSGHYTKQLQNQFKRLFSSTISIIEDDKKLWRIDNIQIAKRGEIWVHEDGLRPVWGGSVTLTENFFQEILDSPVPLDLAIMDKLKSSALAMDIYAWLSYRIFTLKSKGAFDVKIPWEGLQSQFGSNYGGNLELFELDTEQIIKAETQAKYDFKRKFIHQLKNVLVYYPRPADYISIDSDFLILRSGKAITRDK